MCRQNTLDAEERGILRLLTYTPIENLTPAQRHKAMRALIKFRDEDDQEETNENTG